MSKVHLVLYTVLIGLGSSSGLFGQEGQAEPIGNDSCLTCHEVSAGYLSSVHAAQECEGCHGPGSLHMDGGGDATLIRGKQATDWVSACLSCHALGEQGLSRFLSSPHGRHQVECRECHQVHPEKGASGLLKADSVDLCTGCHRPAEASFRKPFHHPVLEGGMECVDCHNPHAERHNSLRRMELVSAHGCTSCHADKKGPFVFPHAAVEEGVCMSCHEPHGSFNSKMLVRTQIYQLCLECHSLAPGVATSQPPSFHDIRSARYRNCTTCHREIHGSNVNKAFLR